MKKRKKISMYFVFAFLLSLLTYTQENKILWDSPEYSLEFKYLREKQPSIQSVWDNLSLEQQESIMSENQEAAGERYNEVKKFYDVMMGKWDFKETEKYLYTVSEEDINTVYLWLGKEKGDKLKEKINNLKYLVGEMKAGELTDEKLKVFEEYFKPEVVNNMKKLSQIEEQQFGKFSKQGETGLMKEVKEFSGKTGKDKILTEKDFSKTYDGSDFKGNIDATISSEIKETGNVSNLKNNFGPNTIKHSSPPSLTSAPAKKEKGRGLSEDEMSVVYEIFGDKVDYSKVKIITGKDMTLWGKILTSGGAAVTWGNTIYFPNNKNGESQYDFNTSPEWLAHEMTHVYQYQKDGWGYVPKSIWEQITKGGGAYDYDNALANGKELSDYGVEQQAVMIEDYFRSLSGGYRRKYYYTWREEDKYLSPEQKKIIEDTLRKEGLYKNFIGEE